MSKRSLPVHGQPMPDHTADGFRWDIVLVWFMRLLAFAWLVKGLAYWAILLGFMPRIAPFEAQALQWQSVVIYFAVIDLVAAIGLWLTSAWGGIMWLLTSLSYFLVAFLVPHAVVTNALVLFALSLLVFTYFILTWLKARFSIP